jgi:hypothetical protein
VELFDLLPALSDARADGPLFYRTDTGWTGRGAFHAARALAKEAAKLVPSLRLRARLDEHFLPAEIVAGNLMGLRKLLIADEGFRPAGPEALAQLRRDQAERLNPELTTAKRVPAERRLWDAAHRPVRVFENAADDHRPRAVLVGDRLGEALAIALAEHFSRCVFFRSPDPPLEAIELESPDIVIHVKDERFLLGLPGSRPVESVG